MAGLDTRAKELIRQGDYLFGKKMTLNSLHQEIADNFYPERADFTTARTLGTDFAANLTTSYPPMARRELGNLFATMLRPVGVDWFEASIFREDKLDNAGRGWLQDKSKVMKRAMYDKPAQFIRATVEGDHDFAAFGQCVLTTELNRMRNGLLYRCWHLRDVAWSENAEGAIDTVHRKWKPTIRELVTTYGIDKLHPKLRVQLEKDPYFQVQIRNIIIPSEYYNTNAAPDGKNWKTKFVEITVDCDNEFVIEEIGVKYNKYSIPRWQTVSGSQYAYSPATVVALPDARMIQAMSLTLLEAGEKAANPPMIVQHDVLRSDISLYAGGYTMVNSEYDEKLGESIRPLGQDYGHLPFGIELYDRTKQMIMEAFYLNKINLPPPSKEMTAFEVQQRVKEYVNNATPIFQPMEADYNGSICENTFEVLMNGGAFGSRFDMPQSLQGQDVQFIFQSPLHDAADQAQANTFLQGKELLAQAISIDPTVGAMIDAKQALRDVLEGIRTPAKWIRTDADMDKIAAANAQQQQTNAALDQISKGAQVAQQVGAAGTALQGNQGVEGLNPIAGLRGNVQ